MDAECLSQSWPWTASPTNGLMFVREQLLGPSTLPDTEGAVPVFKASTFLREELPLEHHSEEMWMTALSSSVFSPRWNDVWCLSKLQKWPLKFICMCFCFV